MRTTFSERLPGLGAALALGLSARAAAAQSPSIQVAGRIQVQFAAVSGDSSSSWDPRQVVASSFEIRRLRFQTDVRIGDRVVMALQPSFEMGAFRMLDAYLRVAVLPHLGLTLGQEKKPFSRYELTSSNTLPSIERGARFRGLSRAAAQNNLLEENGYIQRDIGASLDAAFLRRRLELKAGVYNGSGESASDVNNAKTFAARVAATLLESGEGRPLLRVAVSVISRDRAVTTTSAGTAFAPDSSRRTTAFGIDAEWGEFRPGPHLILDFATGDHLDLVTFSYGTGRNLGNLRPGAPDSAFSTFRSFHAVGAWRIPVGGAGSGALVQMLEPALRLDYTDPNVARAYDHGILITAALSAYVTQTTAVRAGLDLYRYREGTGSGRTLRAVRVSWQSNF